MHSFPGGEYAGILATGMFSVINRYIFSLFTSGNFIIGIIDVEDLSGDGKFQIVF